MQNSPLISVSELRARLESDSLRVVDCRFDLMNPGAGREQYLEDHVPGAVYADLDKDLAAPVTAGSGRHPLPGVADLAATLGQLGISNDSSVVVYDGGNGGVAARLWWLLWWLGHDAVALLDGGYAAWRAAQLPLRSGEEAAAVAEFSADVRKDSVLELRELLEKSASDDGVCLVDGRDAARFRGEVEPIDAVAGHVPGARNLPFTDAVAADGRCKSSDELRQLWQSVIGDEALEFAVMCGSGVTACHLALSAVVAGYPMPRVYVGSWSEWIRDPARPIATGAA